MIVSDRWITAADESGAVDPVETTGAEGEAAVETTGGEGEAAVATGGEVEAVVAMAVPTNVLASIVVFSTIPTTFWLYERDNKFTWAPEVL
jgi:hypothetical protein